MESQPIIQELLLCTGSSFARRELCEWNETTPQPARSIADQLEDACWSGLVFDMFPDMFQWENRKAMCIWKINQAEQFIRVELGNTCTTAAHETSIDPYYFLPFQIYQN